MSLVTRCPKCESRFLIESEQLSEHDGLVRCGECSHIFDGFAGLENKLPTLTRRLPPGTTHVFSPASEQEPAPISVMSPHPSRLAGGAGANPFANIPNLELDSDPDEDLDQALGPKLEWDAEPLATPVSITSTTPVTATLAPSPVSAPVAAPASASTIRVPAVGARPAAQRDTEPVAEQRVAEVEPSVMRHRTATASSDEPRLSILPAEDPPLRGEARLRSSQTEAADSVPAFSGSNEGMSMVGILLWGIGCFFAMILACGQLVYIYRNDIATSVPVLRPTLETLCARLKCEVSLPRYLDKIKIEKTALDQPGVAPQEGQPSEQVLRLTLRNDYSKSQPWPNLMIELTDPSSTVVVRKALAPTDYLPPTLLGQPFAPYQEVKLAMPLTVSGMQITGFHIQHYFP
jgi:predicted Zn finger-like uncharacterized protein